MADRRRWTPALGCVLIWLAAMALARLPAIELAELAGLDASFRLLRDYRAPDPAPEVELVAFDEASIAASQKPFAMMHEELASVLDALRLAGARAIALDLALPAREFTALQPGAALRLAQSLGRARAAAPLVLGYAPGQPEGDAGVLYAAMAGPQGRGLMLVPADADGALRRIDERLGMDGQRWPLLATRLAQLLEYPGAGGIVDVALGAPFTYTPVSEVLAMAAQGQAGSLKQRFGGKVVLVGAVLPDQDRQRIAVALAAWESGTTVPGLVFQGQAVRSLLHGRMIASLPSVADGVALLALVLVWRLRQRLGVAAACAVVLLLACAGARLALLAHGFDLPLAGPVCALVVGMAWLAASVLHEHRAERARIRSIFAGYVSPAILETILSGALRDGLAAQRQQLAFLFADMRGFTAFCAVTPPEQVIAFLNRYYGAITVPLHRHGATIDKFSGDGIMAFFGAPGHSDNPARDAVLAGIGMLEALRALNAALEAEGQPTLAIGIGVAFGDAVLGNVGTASRHDYTATGAAAALAAHVQQYCKKGPYALLVEGDTFDRAARDPATGAAASFDTFEAELEKHGRVRLAGYRSSEPCRKIDTAASTPAPDRQARLPQDVTHNNDER